MIGEERDEAKKFCDGIQLLINFINNIIAVEIISKAMAAALSSSSLSIKGEEEKM